MSAWLLSIVGITVVGVLVELLLTDSPMSKFVRSIFAFFILFVIIQPIPAFFKNASASVSGGVPLDNALMQEINRQTAAAFAQNAVRALAAAGFENCIVTMAGGRVFVNAWNSVKKDEQEIIRIVAAVCNVSPDAVEVFL